MKRIGIRGLMLFVLASICLTASPLMGAWSKKAFSVLSIDDVLIELYGSRNYIPSDKVEIKVPEIAENSAVVPVSIATSLRDVDSISIFVDNNPVALVAHQSIQLLSIPENTKSGFTTLVHNRIKLLHGSSYITVIVRSKGRLYHAKKYVKVTMGSAGCGVSNSVAQAVVYKKKEKYQRFENNDVVLAAQQSTSTFSIDVDTGSYSNVRRFLNAGQLPPKDAVRVEEMINYFNYDYKASKDRETPFNVITEVAKNPWNKHNYLMHIGLKGYELQQDELATMNLVFLIDVSGSMAHQNKLGLLKASIKLLSKRLRKQDKVSIVVYAGAAGMVLPPTAGDQKEKIVAALDKLEAGGTTNGGQGIELAYKLAKESFVKNGINRVLLGTDGDFNVGPTNISALIRLIESRRKSGIYLTTLGFGSGNYNDRLMESLADKGNGNYAYIDNIKEAQKVLITQMSSTVATIAKDVKIQVEFNPSVVAEYRLIGYENRLLKNKDFKNDKVDAGEIGAGHTVTALYELTLVDSSYRALEKSRYNIKSMQANLADELAVLRVRYKKPNQVKSVKLERIITIKDIKQDVTKTSNNYRFSAAVAAFGQLMRQNDYVPAAQLKNIIKMARHSQGQDSLGYRREFVQLLNTYHAINQ